MPRKYYQSRTVFHRLKYWKRQSQGISLYDEICRGISVVYFYCMLREALVSCCWDAWGAYGGTSPAGG